MLRLLRAAVRRLAKSPAFASLAVAVLALGIGANTRAFSLLDTIFIRDLPYPASSGLLHVTARERKQSNLPGCLSYPHFALLQKRNHTVASIAGYSSESFNLMASGGAVQLEAARVSSNFFAVLAVTPRLGRSFFPGEDQSGKSRVVMLSEHLWRQRFAADTRIIGKNINLDSKPYTVVGVLPANFRFELIGSKVDVWVPALQDLNLLTAQQVEAGACYINAVARISAGSSLPGAQAHFAVLHRRFLREYSHLGDADPKRSLEVVPLAEKLVSAYRATFLALCCTVALFLLLCCANVAGLLLTRALGRHREIAIRVALGATPLHVLSDLLTEGLLLALAGGFSGLLLSLAASRGINHLLSSSLPRLAETQTGLSWRVLVLSAALSAFTGVACSLLPAFQLVTESVANAARCRTRHGRTAAKLVAPSPGSGPNRSFGLAAHRRGPACA
ncbi:MAG: ABC transporter permease [Acidobacteriota bacterium]|nr:ABC transporter permease [Acidobacteriota bacterium]